MASVTITIKDGPLGAIDCSVLFEPKLTRGQLDGDDDLTEAQITAADILESLFDLGDVQNLKAS